MRILKRMKEARLFGSAALLIVLIAVAYMSSAREGGEGSEGSEGSGVCVLDPKPKPVVGPIADVPQPPKKRKGPDFYKDLDDDLDDVKKKLKFDGDDLARQKKILADIAKEAAEVAKNREAGFTLARLEALRGPPATPGGKKLSDEWQTHFSLDDLRKSTDDNLSALQELEPLTLTPELQAHVGEIIPPTPPVGGPRRPHPELQGTCANPRDLIRDFIEAGTPADPELFDFLKDVRDDPKRLIRKLAENDFNDLQNETNDSFLKYLKGETDDSFLRYLEEETDEFLAEAALVRQQLEMAEGKIESEFHGRKLNPLLGEIEDFSAIIERARQEVARKRAESKW